MYINEIMTVYSVVMKELPKGDNQIEDKYGIFCANRVSYVFFLSVFLFPGQFESPVTHCANSAAIFHFFFHIVFISLIVFYFPYFVSFLNSSCRRVVAIQALVD